MLNIDTTKGRGRDLQIQVSLDKINGAEALEIGETCVTYFLKDLPVNDKEDLVESFTGFTVFLTAKMMQNPYPLYRIYLQWGLKNFINDKIIFEENKPINSTYKDIDFRETGPDYRLVTKAMIELKFWTEKSFRRYGFVK